MKVVHIPGEKRFNLVDAEGSSWGELEYTQKESVMSLNHTGVSPARKGEGLGDVLVKDAIQYARENDLKIRAVCPFVIHFFNKTGSEYSDVQVD